jgi:aspartate racemase
MEDSERAIGIVGGMGPEATLDLFYKILKNTPAETDQEHIHLIIDNNTKIPDRTSFILGKGENPFPYILKSAKMLEGDGVSAICMPCNTSHYFEGELVKNLTVPFISIIKSVIGTLKDEYRNAGSVGIIATVGTLKTKVYEEPLMQEGYAVILPEDPLEEKIMNMIYSVKSGRLKENTRELEDILDWFKEKGCDVVIAGCTEIPLLIPYIKPVLPVIDSTLALAKKIIEFVRTND